MSNEAQNHSANPLEPSLITKTHSKFKLPRPLFRLWLVLSGLTLPLAFWHALDSAPQLASVYDAIYIHSSGREIVFGVLRSPRHMECAEALLRNGEIPYRLIYFGNAANLGWQWPRTVDRIETEWPITRLDQHFRDDSPARRDFGECYLRANKENHSERDGAIAGIFARFGLLPVLGSLVLLSVATPVVRWIIASDEAPRGSR